MSRLPKAPVTWIPVALVSVAGLLAGAQAWARVGGGDSYSGGGSSGDGGGGGGDLLAWVLYLAVRHPAVGLPLLVLVGVGWYLKRRHDQRHALPASTQQNLLALRTGATAAKRVQVKAQLERLLGDDPNFSEILFLDFAQVIYVRYQQARGKRQTEGLRPYLASELFEGLAGVGTRLAKGSFEVEGVVVGSITLEHVHELSDRWRIVCELEANYTERLQLEGEPERASDYFVRSRMSFGRRKTVLSKGPEQIRALGCPSCASPIKLDLENLCAYCGNPVTPGLFDWELISLEEGVRQLRREVALPLGGREVGTDFPTLFDPDLDVASKSFLLRYPGESLQTLLQRAREVFLQLQQAWTSGDWQRARAFETDRLFQTHLFWMSRYQERGLRNLLEQVEVQDVTLVKLGRDAFYETATLRIRAAMLDYTFDSNDNLISGSRTEPRVFSEYWTFLRRSGFDPGKQSGTLSCPSCGAPVQVAMSGRCEYCDANLASGQFDWTLATIEQDEAYVG